MTRGRDTTMQDYERPHRGVRYSDDELRDPDTRLPSRFSSSQSSALALRMSPRRRFCRGLLVAIWYQPAQSSQVGYSVEWRTHDSDRPACAVTGTMASGRPRALRRRRARAVLRSLRTPKYIYAAAPPRRPPPPHGGFDGFVASGRRDCCDRNRRPGSRRARGSRRSGLRGPRLCLWP